METNKLTFSQEEKNKIKQDYKQLITSANMLMELVKNNRLSRKDADSLGLAIRAFSKRMAMDVKKGVE